MCALLVSLIATLRGYNAFYNALRYQEDLEAAIPFRDRAEDLRRDFGKVLLLLADDLQAAAARPSPTLPHVPVFVQRGWLLDSLGHIITQIPPTSSALEPAVVEGWYVNNRHLMSPRGVISASWPEPSQNLFLMYSSRGSPFLATIDELKLAEWVREWGYRRGLESALTRRGQPVVDASATSTPIEPVTDWTLAPGFWFGVRISALHSPPFETPTRERPDWWQRSIVVVVTLLTLFALVFALGYWGLRQTAQEMHLSSLRSRLVAGITHDLKTPLTSIRLLTETVRLGRTDVEDARELLGTVIDETDRLQRVIDNALSSARIENGSLSYRPVRLIAQESAKEAARRFDSVLNSSGFELTEHYESDDLEIIVDPDSLLLAMHNLLHNAVKYSDEQKTIQLEVRRLGVRAVLTVTDFGIGIPPGELKQVIKPFRRGSNADANSGGAGLGLSLVHHFVKAHGGRLQLQSELGSGTAVSIVLPLAHEHTND